MTLQQNARSSGFLASLLFLCYINQFLYLGRTELVYAVAMFRHGVRQPLEEALKFDVYDHWKSHSQHLTEVGARQHYLLGSTFRKIYVEDTEFLSPNYNTTEVYIQTTNVNRTFRSAGFFLSGLYPMGTGPDLPDGFNETLYEPTINVSSEIKDKVKDVEAAVPLNYQPIPVHAEPWDTDWLLNAWSCPNFIPIINESFNDDFAQSFYDKYKENMTQIADFVGFDRELLSNYQQVQMFGDFVEATSFEQYEYPIRIFVDEDENGTLIEHFKSVSIFYTFYPNEEMILLTSSKLFQTILDKFNQKINPNVTFPEKFSFFSAHDLNLIGVLENLGLSNYSCINESYYNPNVNKTNCAIFPVYASIVRFELHKDDLTGDYKVKFHYNNDTYDICDKKILNDTFCDFGKFEEVLSARILSDKEFNDSCGVQTTSDEEESFLNEYLLSIILSVVLVILVFIYVWVVQYKKRLIGLQSKKSFIEVA